MKALLGLIRLALGLAAIALLAAGLVWRIAHGRPELAGWVVIGYVAAPWLAVVALVLGVCALFARGRIAPVLLALAAMVALAPFARALVPRGSDATNGDAARIKVLSLNTSAQSIDAYGPNEAARLARLIVDEQPDIVLLQELSQWEWPALRTQLRAIPGGEVYNGLVTNFNDTTILSRHPMRQVAVPVFKTSVNHAVVLLPGGPVDVWSVHTWRDGFLPGRNLLSYDVNANAGRPDIKTQIAWIARQSAGGAAPVIVAGDFNAPMASPLLQPMHDVFREVQVEAGAGFGFTFPNSAEYTRTQRFRGRNYALWSPVPLTRIDHIFVSPEFVVHAARAGERPVGSDHRYVIAEVSVNTSGTR